MTQSISGSGAQADATQILASHARRMRVRALLLFVGAILVVAAFLVDLVTGSSNLAPSEALMGLARPDKLTRANAVILFEVRLPMASLAALVGVALALAGAEVQTILDNPLASPFTLGLSSSASFGAALTIVLGLHIPVVAHAWSIPVAAFVCAGAAAMLVQAIGLRNGVRADTLILFGIALMFAANAGIALLQFVATAQALQQLVFWTLGGLTRARWDQIAVLASVLAVVAPFSLRACKRLDALTYGDERAASLGVDVRRVRFASLLRVSILTGGAVAFVGTIAFIGLVAPHMARLLVGQNHRFYLPASALAGALTMSLASIASKLIAPGVIIPVGIVTSVIGVPVFVLIILMKSRR